jgi:SAM-dependent methyltransferase
MLATVAGTVLGLDIGSEAIEHARQRYGSRSNLAFDIADCTRLDHLPDASFDLIVSFETLEHVAAQESMLDGFARLLSPDGILLLSTPDKRTYSDLTGFVNEHHVRELYRDEFEALIDARFRHRRLFGQKLLFQSVLWEAGSSAWDAAVADAAGQVTAGLDYAPVYYVAACAQSEAPLTALPGLHLYGDRDEAVYAHYYAEIRKGIAAGGRIVELEEALQRERSLRAALEARLKTQE